MATLQHHLELPESVCGNRIEGTVSSPNPHRMNTRNWLTASCLTAKFFPSIHNPAWIVRQRTYTLNKAHYSSNDTRVRSSRALAQTHITHQPVHASCIMPHTGSTVQKNSTQHCAMRCTCVFGSSKLNASTPSLNASHCQLVMLLLQHPQSTTTQLMNARCLLVGSQLGWSQETLPRGHSTALAALFTPGSGSMLALGSQA